MNENKELRDIKDSLDSLHQRMDRFYAWASQLQVEMRNAHQRIGFLETAKKDDLVFHGTIGKATEQSEASILARLSSLKHK
jgi:hypothetical protein